MAGKNDPFNSGISTIHGGQMANVAPKDGFTAPPRRPVAGLAPVRYLLNSLMFSRPKCFYQSTAGSIHPR